jgi:hypothetical protein
MLKVQRRMCATCIYRPDSPLDLKKLEDDVRDPHMGFKGHRVCHHSTDVCCRGFWEAHKDEFPAGQIAQRLKLVQFVDVDILAGKVARRRKQRENASRPGAAGFVRPVLQPETVMPNRELKEERRKAGEADPATRRRLMNESMGIKKTDSEKARERAASPPKPSPEKKAGSKPKGNASDIARGVDKLLNPKKNIEKQLQDLGV